MIIVKGLEIFRKNFLIFGKQYANRIPSLSEISINLLFILKKKFNNTKHGPIVAIKFKINLKNGMLIFALFEKSAPNE